MCRPHFWILNLNNFMQFFIYRESHAYSIVDTYHIMIMCILCMYYESFTWNLFHKIDKEKFGKSSVIFQ